MAQSPGSAGGKKAFGDGRWAMGDAAADAIFAERDYSNLGTVPRKTGVLHASGLRWSLAGLSDAWARLRDQVSTSA